MSAKSKLDKIEEFIAAFGEKPSAEAYDLGYRILDTLKVKIDEDPVEVGFDIMKQKLARAANMHGLAVRLLRRAIRRQVESKRLLRVKEESYKQQFAERLGDDDYTSGGRSREDRTAMVDTSLKEEIGLIRRAKDTVEYANAFVSCCKMTADHLLEAKETISRQFSIIQQEVNLQLLSRGSFSGGDPVAE